MTRPPETLQRRKPNPIPPISPLPERQARGSRKAAYEDTKAVLQVPWMGVVTMAFAHYPRFYEALWGGLRPLCASAPFVSACGSLRSTAEARAASLRPEPLTQRLRGMGYDSTELSEIGDLIEVFSHGNMPYLLIATMARLLLEGHALSKEIAAPPFPGVHGHRAGVRLTLVEQHHADAALTTLYGDIRETLGLPFVNTDYRALARWPSYFSLAWGDLRPHIATDAYRQAVGAVHEEAVRLALTLPNPGILDPAKLRDAAIEDGALEQIQEVVALFQWLLPGLATNVGYFRAQLIPSGEAER